MKSNAAIEALVREQFPTVALRSLPGLGTDSTGVVIDAFMVPDNRAQEFLNFVTGPLVDALEGRGETAPTVLLHTLSATKAYYPQVFEQVAFDLLFGVVCDGVGEGLVPLANSPSRVCTLREAGGNYALAA